jgi:type VI protein secretion system component VasA
LSAARFDKFLSIGSGRNEDMILRASSNKDRLRSLEQTVTTDNFLLGCTPVVNLFPRGRAIRISLA